MYVIVSTQLYLQSAQYNLSHVQVIGTLTAKHVYFFKTLAQLKNTSPSTRRQGL